uniref:NADH-ubiquinone oxidoreductase chain 2 n=1 Tax=Scolytinae sp. BMNH 1040052 TaxID=1903778 RepID=A0A343A515_9CUCU|nr:NADH dehydrogenase subunit 2 [Scolytinae sp. BMNH 1040052]
MNKFYKTMFFSMILVGTILAISSMSWLSAWVGLEINLLSLMPLMKNFKNKYSTEAALKYFITQALASMLILLSSLTLMNNSTIMTSNYDEISSTTLSMALLMKMGAAPLHFWLPEVTAGSSWPICLLILTWQKIAPMMLLMYSTQIEHLMMAVILLSSTIGGLYGMNQTCMRKILAYSSVNHIGWMLATLMVSLPAWLIYFLTYSMINTALMTHLHTNKIFFINQLNSYSTFNNMNKLYFNINFLSLGGLPPLLGFLPKWISIHTLTTTNMFYMSTILILSTLVSLFIYLRITFTSITLTTLKSTTTKMEQNLILAMMLTNLSIFGLALMMSLPNMP